MHTALKCTENNIK